MCTSSQSTSFAKYVPAFFSMEFPLLSEQNTENASNSYNTLLVDSAQFLVHTHIISII
jgi:hypothetical protein